MKNHSNSAKFYPAHISFGSGQKNVSTLSQRSFFWILLNWSILPFTITYPKVFSQRAPCWRQRKQHDCCGGATFFFHNQTWTIVCNLGSLRVYVLTCCTGEPPNEVQITKLTSYRLKGQVIDYNANYFKGSLDANIHTQLIPYKCKMPWVVLLWMVLSSDF